MSALYFTTSTKTVEGRASPFYATKGLADIHCNKQNKKSEKNGWKARYSVMEIETTKDIDSKEIRTSLSAAVHAM
jgi:hypothetical protein